MVTPAEVKVRREEGSEWVNYERIEDFGPKPEPICGSNVMVGVAIRFGIVVV